MAHNTIVQRAHYAAMRATHRCTDCPASARQAPDGHWLSLCERCAERQRRGHQRRYLRLLEEHKCVSCTAPAVQHADGWWYTLCAKHMLYIATYDGAKAAQEVIAQREEPLHGTNGR